MANTFSIIIPFYNSASTIGRTLASLISNNESIKEILLINDRSEDNWAEVIKPFQETFFKNKLFVYDNEGEKGPGPARRTGILKATGDWICMVDADDVITPNALNYAESHIYNLGEELVLLHSMSIYYESGTFNKDNIHHSDNSCGGNLYKRQYLIDNNLLPHETLYLAEDEYFTGLVDFFIKYKDNHSTTDRIKYFNYPLYEVHHDKSNNISFAFRHWNDYLVKYHLLYNRYLLYRFYDIYDKTPIADLMVSSFIFCSYLAQGLEQSSGDNFDLNDYKQDFKDYIQDFTTYLQLSKQYVIDWANVHAKSLDSNRKSASISIGYNIEHTESMADFINRIYDDEVKTY